MFLFLDFDGVLHPTSGASLFNPKSMRELEIVLEKFPMISIVITSSWREEKSAEELIALLGPCLGKRVVGTTPIIDDPFLHNPRYHEVCTYIESVTDYDKSWVAVDDEQGNYPEGSSVVITDRRLGFTKKDRGKLIKLIQGKLKIK